MHGFRRSVCGKQIAIFARRLAELKGEAANEAGTRRQSCVCHSSTSESNKPAALVQKKGEGWAVERSGCDPLCSDEKNHWLKIVCIDSCSEAKNGVCCEKKWLKSVTQIHNQFFAACTDSLGFDLRLALGSGFRCVLIGKGFEFSFG